MADIQALKTEVTTDPLARGYAGMTEQQVADSLNTVNRTRIKASLTGDEVFNAADPAELAALAKGLPDAREQFLMFLTICARESVNPAGNATTRLIREIFGAGSTTLSNLGTLRNEAVSRGVEIGFGTVGGGDVTEARS